MNGTDPSGHIFIIDDLIIGAVIGMAIGAVGKALDLPVLTAIGGIISCGTGIGCAAGFAFGSTIGAGGDFDDALKNGILAGASAYAFSQIGGAFDAKSGFWAKDGLGHIAAHGLTGGVMSVLRGGKFGHGFIAAGLTKAFTPAFSEVDAWKVGDVSIGQATVAATLGGTISAATGGKFANGAITAAFGNIFNQQKSSVSPPGSAQQNSAKLKYNKPPPATVPPTGETLEALQCTADCLGLDEVLVTGGSETTGHSPNSLHSQNKAVDIAGPRFNNVDTQTVLECASGCGFSHGHFESFSNNANREHWHVQTRPENYRNPDEHKLK